MSYMPQSDCERIKGDMYYYLHASGAFTVFIQIESDMYKIAHDVPTIEQARHIASAFAKIRKDFMKDE